MSGYSSVLPVSTMVSGVDEGLVGSAGPTMAAAGAEVDGDEEEGELLLLLPHAAARSASGTAAAAVYIRRSRLATGGYSLTQARGSVLLRLARGACDEA